MSKRTEELKIRISPKDKEQIKLKMEDAGILAMSAYVCNMALDGICIRLDLKDVRQLISMLQWCMNNLNQYAKRANETGSRTFESLWEQRHCLQSSTKLQTAPV